MRICILCEVLNVQEVRNKIGRQNILNIGCSETGLEPITHFFCCMATDERGAKKYLERQNLTIMEISEPKEFLEKWKLKIIK